MGLELRGRHRERETLDRLLRDVRAGRSRVLVLRGEPGVGKTALLDYLTEHAPAGRVVRSAGVEPETELAYSALQQLCAPLLEHLDRLPEPQRDALSTAFGLSSGRPPEGLVIGLAVLGLLAEAAAEQPLICVVDDAQWLDRMSEVILTFVARRLDSESVALIFAVRGTVLDGLPDLLLEGLPDAEARALLDSVLPGLVDTRVRDRIVAETRGNPLALLELPRDLSPAELAFGFGQSTREFGQSPRGFGQGPRGFEQSPGGFGPGPRGEASVAGRVEETFQRRIAALPEDARTLLLAAAVEPVGDVPLLWRAAQRLGVGPEAAAPVEAAGLVEFGARVRFRHPLVRSASHRSAGAAELRAVHHALAEVTDPERDPDRRAWHRAHAAIGPDEPVAAELEQSAGRALARGGRAAAASFLERAAELTIDPEARAARTVAAARARFASGAVGAVPELLAAAELGPHDPVRQAEIERLRARVAFAANSGRAAVTPLLEAADRLRALDPAAARATFLAAIGAAVNAGRLGGDDLRRVAEAARTVPAGDEPAGRLLTAFTTWSLDGHTAAVPLFRRALAAVTPADDLDLHWLAGMAEHEIFDHTSFLSRTEQAVTLGRREGLLPSVLTFRATALIYSGRFADASDLIDEAGALAYATGPSPHPATVAILAAHRGRTGPALEAIESLRVEAEAGGVGWLIGVAGYARAVLHNGHGDYPAALAAARQATGHDDLAVLQWGLAELVEAAARTHEMDLAEAARDRLAARADASAGGWARGTRALADALTGIDPDASYREAIEQLTGTGLDLQTARARLLYGEWLRRENRRADARLQLRPAHDAFATMGAEGFAERAARELLATGETVRKRTTGVRDELTAQEGQIARLAAAGRTNPEIGAVLFLSPRTVEWHLRKIFAKLGVTSRRELATAV
ncbi:LuxR family transcriptional regulator [Actinoplanes sichuanensis]|uniref:BREX system ATP-binding domain-containing protein n=1 Tax=Actinoplanes sichuanensis TaxID=512349 RepID=A0ABW4ARM7_9ACTN|nr:BREX system ATP-binding domain-containing protein [Actinoplanes sichuanensis]BEL02006.1 LuxR family transcriptional regulator [Actinoplanes sichuanensis]